MFLVERHSFIRSSAFAATRHVGLCFRFVLWLVRLHLSNFEAQSDLCTVYLSSTWGFPVDQVYILCNFQVSHNENIDRAFPTFDLHCCGPGEYVQRPNRFL